MRLSKLKIKGYRSIKSNEVLVTDDRVTILIGANDHGKTNLLAAIQCLNDDHPITADDRNWDLNSSDSVEIQWLFSASDEIIQKLRQFGPPPQKDPQNVAVTIEPSEIQAPLTETQIPVSNPTAVPASAPVDTATSLPVSAGLIAETVPLVPIPSSVPSQTPAAAEPSPSSPAPSIAIATAAPILPPTFPVGADHEIIFSRNLLNNEVKVVSAPIPVLVSHEKDVLALRPRVELFESPSGNVVDEVNRAQLDTAPFEFMQGIFRLAGLWDSRNQIFIQNDTTSKQLKEASEVLTKILNDQWNQGKDLKWIFEHTGTNGDTIVIKIEDPAIKGRYTRPSLRSSGFRTYFLLSMIIYARSQNASANSYIYLFDEPGTYLHPSAQLDLQRSFETIADKAQLAYTTHSLFLISKNYPSRNRVISKTVGGTKIDLKPFTKNWKSVRQSLGVLLSNNFLIAEKTLLVEGPSDVIYLLDALKRLKATAQIDVDLNDMSIVDAGDLQNYVAMAKIMLSEGRSVVALADGDASGKKLQAQLQSYCAAELKTKMLQIHLLPDNKSSEDVFADLVSLQKAARKSFEQLVADGSRTPKAGIKIADSIKEICPTEVTTLGKTIEKVTKSWFATQDKISKLLIAIFYEDEVESSKAAPPPEALVELEKIKILLDLRSEKSKQTGVFEEVQ
jgi:predicted ATP-dependent endonuclease of OLD family